MGDGKRSIMHFGLVMECDYRYGTTMEDSFGEAFDLVDTAEAGGLDGVWLAERHFAAPKDPLDPQGAGIPSFVSAPLIMASAIAARTKRLRVGVAVNVLPLIHPIRMAEEAATVDQISQGRFEFGVGRSGFPKAYEGYGVPYGESRERFQESLEVISTPKANVSAYEPLTIEVIVPVKPDINLGDYLDYRLSQEPVEVSEDQIDEVVESIRRDSSTWSPIKRPVELDDMVTIQVKGTMDDTVIIDDQGVEYVVSSESTNPMPGFADQILGMKIGSTKEFTLKFPSDYAQPGLPGKECHFSVFMDEIKKRQLPSVNNNFAKSLNLDVKTVKSLRKKLS